MEFMGAGIPVEKIQGLRKFLEYGRYPLTDSSHMRNLIPEVQILHITDLQALLKSPTPFVSVIFDGTSHGVELFPISLRFWKDKDFIQKLVRFRIVDIPMNADVTAAVLKGAVNRVNVPHFHVIGAIHDSANVNPAAIALLARNDWINAKDLPCHPHIIARVGKKLGVPRAGKFIHSICYVFNKSGKIAAEWRAYRPPPRSVIGGRTVAIPRLSNIRWYNEHEVCVLVIDIITFERLLDFISNGMSAMPDPNDDDDDFMKELKSTQKTLIRQVRPGIRDEMEFRSLRLEMTVFLHYGRPLAKWCYYLEGDYPTLPKVAAAYREIEQALSPSTLFVDCLFSPLSSLLFRHSHQG